MSDIVAEGQMPRVETLGTQEEVESRVKGLMAEGWQSLPCDDPERGTLGCVVFRDLAGDTHDPVRSVGDGMFERRDGARFRGEGELMTDTNKELPGVPILEEVFILEWPIHGRVMDPDVQVVTAEELAGLIAADPGAVPCDDPRARLLGFVWYRPDEGKAIVRRTTLKSLKEAGPEVRGVIQAFRDRLRAEAAPVGV